MANAWLVDSDCVSTSADACGGVVHAAVWLDAQVIVSQQVRKVSVWRIQCDREVVAIGLHRGDAFHDAQGTRLRVFVGMAFHCLQNVFAGQGFAVVEFNTFADFESPGFGIC